MKILDESRNLLEISNSYLIEKKEYRNSFDHTFFKETLISLLGHNLTERKGKSL